MKPYQVAVWEIDPLPMGPYAYVVDSANYWRAVTKATLEARQ